MCSFLGAPSQAGPYTYLNGFGGRRVQMSVLLYPSMCDFFWGWLLHGAKRTASQTDLLFVLSCRFYQLTHHKQDNAQGAGQQNEGTDPVFFDPLSERANRSTNYYVTHAFRVS